MLPLPELCRYRVLLDEAFDGNVTDNDYEHGQAQAVEACASTSSVNSSEGFFQL